MLRESFIIRIFTIRPADSLWLQPPSRHSPSPPSPLPRTACILRIRRGACNPWPTNDVSEGEGRGRGRALQRLMPARKKIYTCWRRGQHRRQVGRSGVKTGTLSIILFVTRLPASLVIRLSGYSVFAPLVRVKSQSPRDP